ncbi:endoplasmic reticulum protein 29-like protein wbl [Rhodnius prolixus]|uniref:Endoplasmic reticulum resident protein 29 n=1 Tax=Rhodnius prolixus TaxID=13249 RepID=R4G7T8_RHOPR
MMTHIKQSLIFIALLINGIFSKGCVQLDSYSFDKITAKFQASLIKFDTAYPYGQKHDAFEAVCESAYSSPDLLTGEVQVKDYGDKDNEDLAKRYGITKDDFPAVKLFLKDKDPVTFTVKDDKDFNADNLKRFIRSKSTVYIGLPGCLETFDKLAAKFIKSNNVEERKKLLLEAEQLWDKAKGNRENKAAETYVKIMRKMLDKGDDFVKNESSRVENVIKGKISKEKLAEMQEKVNILQSFTHHDEL